MHSFPPHHLRETQQSLTPGTSSIDHSNQLGSFVAFTRHVSEKVATALPLSCIFVWVAWSRHRSILLNPLETGQPCDSYTRNKL